MPIKALLSLNPSDRAYQKRVSKRLTRKEELFVKALVSRDGEITNTEAAIEAGYAKELDREYAVTYQRHIKRLDQLSRRAEENGAYSASVMAEYRRGQAQGIYIDRKEILHGSIDQMNKDEVLKRLKEIKNDETRGDTENLIIEHQSQEEVGETLLPEDKKQPEESSENNKQELDVA